MLHFDVNFHIICANSLHIPSHEIDGKVRVNKSGHVQQVYS